MRLLKAGELSRAYQTLTTSTPPVSPSQDYFAALQAKHPVPAQPIRLPVPALYEHSIQTPELTVATLRRGITGSPRESQPGPCGLRFEHLKELVRGTDDKLLQILTTFVNRLITGKGAPKRYYLFLGSARLIGLSKPGSSDPSNIRPIAMGSTLSKLISRCIHRLFQSQFDAKFAPYQFGVGRKRGCETIFHYLEDILEKCPDRIILKIDFTNAFNAVDRSVILAQVHEHFPSLLPWIQARYDQPTSLWAKTSATEACVEILSQQGAQQGDPLAGFLFAMAVLNLLRQANEVVSERPTVDGSVVAYLDDFVLEGSHEAVERAWGIISSNAERVGLTINLSKCGIYSREALPEYVDNYFPDAIIRHTTHLEVLGGVLGDKKEVASFLQKKITDITRETFQVSALKDPQYHMLLLRLCVCQKFTYLMRLIDPTHKLPDGSTFADNIDILLRSCLSRLLLHENDHTIPDDAWMQATLPFAHGGLGILNAPNTHHAAYTASTLECFKDIQALHKLSTRNSLVQSAIVDRARAYHNHIANCAPAFTALNGTQYRIPTFVELLEPGDKKQESLVRSIQAHRIHTVLLEALQSVKARIAACAGTSVAMFQAIPKATTPHLAFSSEGTAYIAATCMQLGLPIQFITPRDCTGCDTGERFVNKDGFHLLSQCKKGNLRYQVHNKLRDELAILVRQAGYHCNIEQSELLRSVDDSTRQRTDITVYGYSPKGPLEIDVSVTDPRTLLQGGARTTPILPQEAATIREDEKIHKYGQRVEEAGGKFIPFVMESFGNLGPRAASLLNKLIEKAHSRSNMPLSLLKAYWTQRLVVAVRSTGMECLRMNALSADRMQPVDIQEEVDELGIIDTSYNSCAMGNSR